MLRIQYNEANNNINFIKVLLVEVQSIVKGGYWGVGDLDIISKNFFDHLPTGKVNNQEIVYKYGLKVRDEGIVFSTLKELMEIFIYAETIRWGVFLYYTERISKEKNICPIVEVQNQKNLQDSQAIFEIRIIDGDLFFLLSREEKYLGIIENSFKEYVIN